MFQTNESQDVSCVKKLNKYGHVLSNEHESCGVRDLCKAEKQVGDHSPTPFYTDLNLCVTQKLLVIEKFSFHFRNRHKKYMYNTKGHLCDKNFVVKCMQITFVHRDFFTPEQNDNLIF
jgi:hypothetical protein